MNCFRFWLTMTAAFLATGTANAQSLSASTLTQLEDGVVTPHKYIRHAPQYFPPAPPFLPYELQALERAQRACATQDCCEASWYMQALHHGMAAWQRLRAGMQSTDCGKDRASTCRDGAGCPLVISGFSTNPIQARTGSLMLGVGVNSANGICGGIAVPQCPVLGITKAFNDGCCPLGYTSGKTTTPPCCCAKACTCCEVCKVKGTAAQLPPPAIHPPGLVQPMYHMPPFPVVPGYAFTPPAPPVPQTAQVWTLPAPPMGARAVVGLPVSSHPGAVAHLVTPEYDAHCQRITHRDGHIVLEGNVMLLCKKHAQPLRVEGQRVVINLKDGTFTVETDVRPTMTTYRIEAIGTPAQPFDLVVPAPVPMRRVIEVPVAPR